MRRFELVSGAAAILIGLVLFDGGWWRWVLVGVGILSLSPWPGARAILRKASHDPKEMRASAERRSARARRVALILVPVYAFFGALVGYVTDGLAAALTMGVLLGVGAAIGAWWTVRH